MKAQCELCNSTDNVILLPTPEGSNHSFCMECAGKLCVEALRWLPMGDKK